MRRALVALVAAVAVVLAVAQRDRLAISIGYVKARLTPKATVEDRLRRYENGARERLAPALQAEGLSYPLKAFTLLAIKDASLLQLFAHDGEGRAVHIKDYPVLAESGTLGPKLREGDGQIPEGVYKVNFLNANSLYHLSLRLDYPNPFDRQMASRDGRTELGGDIMIHGKNVSIGCVAIGDPGIEEVFCLTARAGSENVKVVIVPTDWRTNTFDIKGLKGPAWLPELYTMLKSEIERLR
jgi:murein L,D-transpeptidase YafK